MNDKVKGLVLQLFEGVKDNEELCALRDELMDNCQEHYRDLVSGGMPEDEALRAVGESLNGMREIVIQYAGKGDAEMIPTPETEKDGKSGEAEEPVQKETVWPAEGLRRIRVNAGPHDVWVTGTDGDTVSVSCENPEAFRTERTGDALTVEEIPLADKVFHAEGSAGPKEESKEEPKEENSWRGFMDMSLNEIFRKARSAMSGVMKSLEQQLREGSLLNNSTLRIRVPRGLLGSLEINTGSGDIHLEGICAPDLAVRTASGDVFASFPAGESAERLYISSASGDIRFEDIRAREAQVSATSGDVELRGEFDSLQCRSVSGDVSLKGAARDLRSKSVSGDVTVRLIRAETGILIAEATSGDITLIVPGNCMAAVNTATVSGSVHNELGEGAMGAALRVTARTVSGDIRIRKEN